MSLRLELLQWCDAAGEELADIRRGKQTFSELEKRVSEVASLLKSYHTSSVAEKKTRWEQLATERVVLRRLHQIQQLFNRSHGRVDTKPLKSLLKKEIRWYRKNLGKHYQLMGADSRLCLILSRSLQSLLELPVAYPDHSTAWYRRCRTAPFRPIAQAAFRCAPEYPLRGSDVEGAWEMESHSLILADLESFLATYKPLLPPRQERRLREVGAQLLRGMKLMGHSYLMERANRDDSLKRQTERAKNYAWYMEQVIKRLKPGEVQLVPVGGRTDREGHHLCLEVRHDKPGEYYFSIINTGWGAGSATSRNRPHPPCPNILQWARVGPMSFQIVSDPDLWRDITLFSTSSGKKEDVRLLLLIARLRGYFLNHGLGFKWEGPEFPAQISGSCSFSAPVAWLKGSLPESLFLYFRAHQTRLGLERLLKLKADGFLWRNLTAEVVGLPKEGVGVINALLEAGTLTLSQQLYELQQQGLQGPIYEQLSEAIPGLPERLQAIQSRRQRLSWKKRLQKVRSFWFGPVKYDPKREKSWCNSDSNNREALGLFFGQDLQQALQDPPPLHNAQDRLAYILLCGEIARWTLGRHNHEGSPWRTRALEACVKGLDRGDLLQLSPIERYFFLRPLILSLDILKVRLAYELLGCPTSRPQDKAPYASFLRKRRDLLARKLIWLKAASPATHGPSQPSPHGPPLRK